MQARDRLQRVRVVGVEIEHRPLQHGLPQVFLQRDIRILVERGDTSEIDGQERAPFAAGQLREQRLLAARVGPVQEEAARRVGRGLPREMPGALQRRAQLVGIGQGGCVGRPRHQLGGGRQPRVEGEVTAQVCAGALAQLDAAAAQAGPLVRFTDPGQLVAAQRRGRRQPRHRLQARRKRGRDQAAQESHREPRRRALDRGAVHGLERRLQLVGGQHQQQLGLGGVERELPAQQREGLAGLVAVGRLDGGEELATEPRDRRLDGGSGAGRASERRGRGRRLCEARVGARGGFAAEHQPPAFEEEPGQPHAGGETIHVGTVDQGVPEAEAGGVAAGAVLAPGFL